LDNLCISVADGGGREETVNTEERKNLDIEIANIVYYKEK